MYNPFGGSAKGRGNVQGFSFAPGPTGEEPRASGPVSEGQATQAEMWESSWEGTAWLSQGQKVLR